MKKILFVFGNYQCDRSYLLPNILDPLENGYDCYFVAADDISISRETGGLEFSKSLEADPRFLGYYRISPQIKKAYGFLYKVTRWRFRNRSSSFKFLCDGEAYEANEYENFPKGFFKRICWIKTFLIHNVKTIWSRLLGNFLVFPWFDRYIRQCIPVNSDLHNQIKKLQPDLIVFPFQSDVVECYDLVRISRLCNIPTFFISNNWDNLSKKTILKELPDYIAVWAEQSREHAIDIQGFKPNRVIVLGTPKYENYYPQRDQSLESPFKFDYVLFAGYSIPFDDVFVLNTLEKEIASHPHIYGSLKVVYRTHPTFGRSNCRGLDDNNWPYHHVIPDPQSWDVNLYNKVWWPQLKYFPHLISNAQFVVAPSTTVLIESLFFRKRVLLIGYDDGVHRISADTALKKQDHLWGVDKIEGVTLCKDRNKLAEQFREVWLTRHNLDRKRQEQDVSYYIFEDGTGYGNRLVKAVNQILNEKGEGSSIKSSEGE